MAREPVGSQDGRDPQSPREKPREVARPANESFTRAARLTRGADFELAFSRGMRLVGPHLAIHVRPNGLRD